MAPTSNDGEARKWEHEVVQVPHKTQFFAGEDPNVGGIADTLRAYGEAGWELVTATSYDIKNGREGTLLFFKRPMSIQPPVVEPLELTSFPADDDGFVICQGCGDRILRIDAIMRLTGPLCRPCHLGTRFAKQPETMQVIREDGPYRGTHVEISEKKGPCARCGKDVLASKAYRSSKGSICPSCQANED